MNDTAAPKRFHDFGDGTFRAVEFWVIEKDTTHSLHQANTLLEWAGIYVVQAWPEPNTIPDEVTPADSKCLVVYRGREMKLLADYVHVAKAWQKYRNEKRRRKQITRFPKLGRN